MRTKHEKKSRVLNGPNATFGWATGPAVANGHFRRGRGHMETETRVERTPSREPYASGGARRNVAERARGTAARGEC